MWRYLALRRFGVIFAETLLLICCGILAYLLKQLFSRDEFPLDPVARWFILGQSFFVAVIFQITLHLNDIYRFSGARLSLDFTWRLVRAVVMAVCAAGFIFYWLYGLAPGRIVFVLNLTVSSLFIFFWHTLLCFYMRVRPPQVNLLVLGTSDLVHDVVCEVVNRPDLGIKIVGFVADDSALVGTSIGDSKVIGVYTDLPRLVAEHNVTQIIVGLKDNRGKLPIKELLEFKTRGMSIEEATTFYERVTGKIPVENLKPSWLVFNSGFAVSSGVFLRKRIVSIIFSAILLVLTSPLILLAVILIKLDSRGPVFYKQERVGQNGRIFTLVKFRSMRQDAEKGTGPVWSSQTGDSRVTRIGRLLRRTRIDELPQIYNVFCGDMNMVGPRPERPFFVQQLSEEIPYYPLRHVVKPGITGWAQINYGYANTLEHTIEKLQYDLFYIKNMTWLLDVMIVAETIKTVLVRKGS